ncbi:hypothetical protein JTE90_016673 [Oedothorax gibbosus]|uniref:Uncharacterized protein n=1 Tax=Oedothorax gibbosus TaxID=931172 RepID=A0AAV6V390_9ARAC|nr:hypothetical protein JTE90_016673 [Oedothorax gibbosus]
MSKKGKGRGRGRGNGIKTDNFIIPGETNGHFTPEPSKLSHFLGNGNSNIDSISPPSVNHQLEDFPKMPSPISGRGRGCGNAIKTDNFIIPGDTNGHFTPEPSKHSHFLGNGNSNLDSISPPPVNLQTDGFPNLPSPTSASKGCQSGRDNGLKIDKFTTENEEISRNSSQLIQLFNSHAKTNTSSYLLFPDSATVIPPPVYQQSGDYTNSQSPISGGRGKKLKNEEPQLGGVETTTLVSSFSSLGLREQSSGKPLTFGQTFEDGYACGGESSSSDFGRGSPESDELVPYDSKWAPRPNFGKAGRPIELVSNYFKLTCNTGNIYHYHMEINSLEYLKKYGKGGKTQKTANEAAKAKVPKLKHQLERNVGKLKCREVFEKLIQMKALREYNPVYDGWRNIFTSKPFPFSSKQSFIVELEVFGKMRKYEVTVQPVKKANGTNVVDLKSMRQNYNDQNELIMAYTSIMNHRDPPCRQINLGRSFFFLSSDSQKPLGEGLEIWFGYNQSIHWTHRGPALVINLAAKAFHKAGPVLEYLNELLHRDIHKRGQGIRQNEIRKIEEQLKGVKITVTHLTYKRKYTIKGLSKVPAENLKLNYDGKDLTVVEYFKTKYTPLHYPHLHCLHMRAANNQTYIPIENCIIVEGQPMLGKLNPALNSKMIKQTAIAPVERFKSIDKNARCVQAESGGKMKSYNILMDLAPRKFLGRVIDPPTLTYVNGNTKRPDIRGVWRIEGQTFFRAAADIQSWILLCFAERCNEGTLRNFADTFVKTGKKLGLNFGRFLGTRKFSSRDPSEKVLREAEQTQASFAIIVLSRFDSYHNYDEIKFIADYKLGFVTQCMEESVLSKFNDQIATNVCLKVNTKLGGVNHVLNQKPKVLSKPVMILGADAVHCPRGSGCPSIAAVVGSMDAFPSRYKVACRVQDNPDGNKLSQEVILDIKNMVKFLINAFYHNTKGKWPEKIIFFRDGVSEGQFEKVRDEEVHEVQMASQEVIGKVVPITFIIVQKRHQTRFRPVNPSDGVGKMGNVPPGTTVDNEITHPNHFDYFLSSHEGIQGTSKPAHYTVLHDDNNFDADELQQLSYHLCFTYGKCNRSISIPAPVQYADLACYRAKKYADFHLQKERECGSFSSNSSSHLPDHVRDAINAMGDYKKNMFFL